MFLQTGGGGKGIRPNQQHQQQPQQQQQPHHHQSHHQSHHQAHHPHAQQQQQQASASVHHGHPSQQSHSHHPPPHQHQHQPAPPQHQQQQLHHQAPPQQLPYYSYQLSQAAQPLPGGQHPQVSGNATHTPSPPTQVSNAPSAGSASNASGTQQGHGIGTGSGNAGISNLGRQQGGGAASIQHYSNSSALMQPPTPTSTAYMTTTYLQQFHPPSAAVMAAVAAQYNSNAVAAAAAAAAGNHGSGSGGAQTATSLYQAQQQQQQHHQSLHHAQTALHATHYYQAAGGATPTAPSHMHPHHHPSQHQLRSVLSAHQRGPAGPYLLPPNTIFALPGPMGPPRTSILTGAHQQSGAAGSALPVAPLLQSAAGRGGVGGPTTYIPSAFCQPPVPMGATSLTSAPPLLASAASLAPPALQTYGHVGGTPIASSSATSLGTTPSGSAGSMNPENVKPRPHAIPIIHPITHENILDPKPQKKSTAVEAKPSVVDVTASANVGTGEQQKSVSAGSLQLQPKESDKSITVSMSKAPSASASKEKIDQQMQTDAVRHKSSGASNKVTGSQETTHAAATITTESALEFSSAAVVEGKYMAATTSTTIVPKLLAANDSSEVSLEGDNGSVDIAEQYDQEDEEEQRLTVVLEETLAGTSTDGDVVSENATTVGSGEDDVECTSQIDAGDGGQEEHMQLNDLDDEETVKQFQNKAQHQVAFSNTVTEEIAAALKAKATAENEQALKLKQQQQKATVAQTSKLSTATLPQNAVAATSGASSSGTSTPTQQKQKKSAKESVAASSNAVSSTNSKKRSKASKRKETQKKLLSKQNDNSNRSNPSSGSSNINNNINNNSSSNSISVSGGKSFALNAVSVCDNNNDTTTAIITTTAATATKTRNLTDINNANNFSSSAIGNLSNLRETPFAVNLRQQQQQQQQQHQQQQQQLLLRGANNNNNTRSTNSTTRSGLSVAASKCESRAEDTLSQSSTETASQQRKHVKTQEIVAQYLQTPNSIAKTSEEQQLQFLNSSSSACEDDEEINARLQLQDAAAMHLAAAGELRFGEFADMPQFEMRMTELKPAVAATMTTAVTSTASPPITTTTLTSNIQVNTNKSKVEITEIADTVDCSAVKTLLPPARSRSKADGQIHKATTRPKRLTYTLIELKELAKSADARKPPLVFCQKGDCIAQLFVSHQQHHHAAHNVSPLALHQHLQYHQHMNYSESMEYVTGKRGRGGQAKKQHHEHQSGAAMGGSAGIVGMGGVASGSSGAGGSSAQRKMDMIHVHLSLKEEIKLSECENAWQPETLRSKSSSSPSAAPNDDLELVLKKVRGVLNKLTPDNFDVLRNTMTSVSINTEEKMQQVMLLIFEKTIREPNFAPTYAKFCKVIFQEIKAEGKPLFSSALILRIQQEFETNVNDADAKRIKLQPLVDKLETCTDPKERIDLQAELEDQEYQFRRRAWGTVRFIGEMYKLQSLTNDRVLMCIESLLKHGCEEKLEYMCKLLTTVGHLLDGIGSDQSSSNARMEKIFRGIREFVQKPRGSGNKVQSKISSRVRFMMQDVLDLRSRNWDQPQPQSQQRRSTLKQDEKTQSAVGSSNVGSGGVYEENNNRMRYGNHGNTRQTRDSGTFFPQKSKYVQQQHTIDLEKLKFGSCFQSTTQLGNSSTYKWPSMTGATATATATATAVQTQTLAPIVVPSGASANSYASNSSGGFKQNTATSKRDKSPAAYEQLPSGSASSDARDDGSEQLSAKECQKVLNHLVEEMLDDSSSWQKDALSTWYKSGRKQQVSLLFHLLISYLHLRDVKRPQRTATASIFMALMRQSSFDKSVFAQAYKEFGEDFPDLLVDVPQGWTYVFDFLGPLLHERLLQFADIWLPQWSEHAAFTQRFLKTLVTHFRDEYGATYTRELWTNHFKLDCGQQFMWDAATWGVFVAANSFEFLHDCNCKPPPPQSQRATSEQVERIGFLLNTSGECDLVIDYITTNVQINATFITNLAKFLCCDYATVMTTHNNNTATTTTIPTPMSSGQSADIATTQHLNEELFRSKCTPLLRLCIDASETHELACLDAIVDSMQYFDDAATANKLICSIFDVLYECEVIPKDSFDKWYRGRVSSVREAAEEVVDTKQTHASSQSQQLSRELRAYMEKLL